MLTMPDGGNPHHVIDAQDVAAVARTATSRTFSPSSATVVMAMPLVIEAGSMQPGASYSLALWTSGASAGRWWTNE